MTILGITGHPASGKDTVADYLVLKGFLKISMGDILREEMQKQGIPTDRAHVHEFVRDMRKKGGNSYPAHEVIKRIRGNTVTCGIRNTEEVRIFREKFATDFKFIAVDAPIDVRYPCAKERRRIGDDISFEQFEIEEERERAHDSGSHEVDLVMAQADFKIINDATKEDLFGKIDKVLSQIEEH